MEFRQRHLHDSDIVGILETLEHCMSAQSQTDVVDAIGKLNDLFSSQHAAAALARFDRCELLVDSGGEHQWLRHYIANRCWRIRSTTVQRLSREVGVQYWSHLARGRGCECERAIRREMDSLGLPQCIIAWFSCPQTGRCSIISLLGNQLLLNGRTVDILRIVLPHYHLALSRICSPYAKRPSLTTRELEVLRWMVYGKTNPEIAQLLTVGERTVKFHVHNLLDKFHVTTRTQAVTAAIFLGIIENIEDTESRDKDKRRASTALQ